MMENGPQALGVASWLRASSSSVLSSVTIGPESSSVCLPMSSQSTGVPLAIDSAIDSSRTSSSLALMGHLLCELDEGAAEGHVYGRSAGLLEHHSHLLVREPHLDAGDDQILVLRSHPLESFVVSVERLLADGHVER